MSLCRKDWIAFCSTEDEVSCANLAVWLLVVLHVYLSGVPKNRSSSKVRSSGSIIMSECLEPED